MPAQRFPLPMWGMLLLGVLLFGGGPVLFTYKAEAVILDDETATFPGTMFRPAAKTFAYKDIRSVVTQNVAGNIFVTVTHRGGKAAVAKRTLADGAFETIVSTLETRAEVGPPVRASRS